MLFNKCSHCQRLLPIGKVKCPNLLCKLARAKKARSERIRNLKKRIPEYYLKRMRSDIRCTKCGKQYECYHLAAINLPPNFYFGTCTNCKTAYKRVG